MELCVSWFSGGVSSAVATKLEIDKIDKIVYIHIDDQHPDTLRFVKDCEKWFKKSVEILQSPFKSVENVCVSQRFITGPQGACCTKHLKRLVRKRWEYEYPDFVTFSYVWGMDCTEKDRADRLAMSMPGQNHINSLVDRGIDKKEAHKILRASGINRPKMYELGYNNNNCIGCVKGGCGYWNKIRVDFPEVFENRAKMERSIGRSCIKDCFLDQLDPKKGRGQKIIIDECGIFCEQLILP